MAINASGQDVISELEFLTSQHAILTFSPQTPIEIPAEDLYQRDGELIYDLKNLSTAEYNAMLIIENDLKEAMLKAGKVTVIGEEERKKIPEELIKKINHYARKGRSVLDLSGKRFIVTRDDLPKKYFANLVKFLKEKDVPENYITEMLPRAFGEKTPTQSTDTIRQNFKMVKGKLSEQELDEFYRIYERDIEPFEREKLTESVQCLEGLIENSDGFSIIEQPPFELIYIDKNQRIPTKWSTVSTYSIEDKLQQPVTIDLLGFNKTFANWFMRSLSKKNYATEETGKAGKFIKLNLDAQKVMVKQSGDNVMIVTVPELYSNSLMQKAEAIAERSLGDVEKPFEMDYIPAHISIPEGFTPIVGHRRKKREEAEKRIKKLFGENLLKPAERKLKSDDHTKDQTNPHYNGIHTTFMYPLKMAEMRTAIAEVQTFTWLGYIDQSDLGRAPHDPYKENKYLVKGKNGKLIEVPELFPTKLSDAVVKRNEYYVKALQRQISEFKVQLGDKTEAFLKENPGYDPKKRFTDLLYAYSEHIIDKNASGDLKMMLLKDAFPLLLELPIAYIMGANFSNTSTRRENMEKMKSEIDFGTNIVGYKFDKTVFELYDAAMRKSLQQNLFEMSGALAEELNKHRKASDNETRLKRFVLSTAVSRLLEEGVMKKELEALQQKYEGLLVKPSKEQRQTPGFDLSKVLLVKSNEPLTEHKKFRELYRLLGREEFAPLTDIEIKGAAIDDYIISALKSGAKDVMTRIGYQP